MTTEINNNNNNKLYGSINYAFTGNNETDHKVIGNTALTIFGSPIEDLKQQIAIDSKADILEVPTSIGITNFITPVEGKGNNTNDLHYNIRFRLCDGYDNPICGHGANGAVGSIIRKLNLTGKNQITFHLDQNHECNRSETTLVLNTNDNEITTHFSDVNLIQLDDTHAFANEMLKEMPDLMKGSFHYTRWGDYICVGNDSKALREHRLSDNFIKNVRKIDKTYRHIMVVCKASISPFDYESHVYGDNLPKPTYEDYACGSANTQIPQLLKKMNVFPNRFQEGEKEEFLMCYPHSYSDNGNLGGVQKVVYDHKKGLIDVISGVKYGKKVEVDISKDEESISIKYSD